MGDSSIKITKIAHARFLFGIGDVEEIAAPNLMRIETANECVDFIYRHKPGEGGWPYNQPAVTFVLLLFGWRRGKGERKRHTESGFGNCNSRRIPVLWVSRIADCPAWGARE